MQAVNFFFINTLLFASLIAVVGVPYFYMTQSDPSDRRNPEIKKVEIIGGVWFHLVLIEGVIANLI